MSEPFVLGQSRLNEAEAYTNMLEALGVAVSSARQLAYLRDQPEWMKVQLAFENMRELVTRLAQAGSPQRSLILPS